jgi:hypothetical protein
MSKENAVQTEKAEAKAPKIELKDLNIGAGFAIYELSPKSKTVDVILSGEKKTLEVSKDGLFHVQFDKTFTIELA